MGKAAGLPAIGPPGASYAIPHSWARKGADPRGEAGARHGWQKSRAYLFPTRVLAIFSAVRPVIRTPVSPPVRSQKLSGSSWGTLPNIGKIP